MKADIIKEVLHWLEEHECEDEESVKNFVNIIMDKTTEGLLEEVKKQLKNEFDTGTLKHDFIISPEYYLELKLKEAKQNFSKSIDSSILTDPEYSL
ncbi:MAG: hypothetical protein R6V50_01105 [Thermoplasmatota archaeon]